MFLVLVGELPENGPQETTPSWSKARKKVEIWELEYTEHRDHTNQDYKRDWGSLQRTPKINPSAARTDQSAARFK